MATLKGFFVCNQCRATCSNGDDEVGPFGPDRCPEAYHPRKQRLNCLGPYCDRPCALQEEVSDLTYDQLIALTLYLADYLDTFLITKKTSKSE